MQNAGAEAVLGAAKVFKTVDSALSGIVAKGNKNTKGTANFAYGPFVGSQILNVAVTETEVLGKTAKRASPTFIASKGKTAETIAGLEQAQINEILKDAEKLCNQLQDYKKVQGEYDAITKASNKTAETVMASATKILDKTGSSQEVRAGLQELKSEISNCLSTLGSFGNRGPALVFSTVKAMADYASISMANLK